MSAPPKFSYEARRFPLKILIGIADGHVDWSYACLGNSWSHSTPLATLDPYPMFSEHKSGLSWLAKVFPFAVLGLIVLFMVQGVSTITVAISLFAAAVFLLMIAIGSARGPIRWATFDSKYQNKDVFFFQGGEEEEFEVFVEQMTSLILSARLAENSSEPIS